MGILGVLNQIPFMLLACEEKEEVPGHGPSYGGEPGDRYLSSGERSQRRSAAERKGRESRAGESQLQLALTQSFEKFFSKFGPERPGVPDSKQSKTVTVMSPCHYALEVLFRSLGLEDPRVPDP